MVVDVAPEKLPAGVVDYNIFPVCNKAHRFANSANALSGRSGVTKITLSRVSLILNARHPMWIGWGREATFLYNDAYVDVLGAAKHPWALGRPAHEVWSEIWDVCGPLADKVFRRAEATFIEPLSCLRLQSLAGHAVLSLSILYGGQHVLPCR
jgi:hypothetical protein